MVPSVHIEVDYEDIIENKPKEWKVRLFQICHFIE
jgi:hypothetical protein